MTYVEPALLTQGEFGQARAQVGQRLTERRDDRGWMVDRMRLAVLTLADGQPRQASFTFEQIEHILRTQGINRDRTVAAIVTWEGVRFWKGEPFEQALALFYYGLQQGSLGQWDNVRAAAGSSLFRLRDFGFDQRSGRRHDAVTLARQAQQEETIAGRRAPSENDDFFNTGFAIVDSDFIPGYILHGVASRMLSRPEEASDYFAAAASLNQDLQPLLREFRDTDYNTVLVVSWGLGPAKIAYGPDEVFTRFIPRAASDRQPLSVRVFASPPVDADGPLAPEIRQAIVPQVMDINTMAADHKWNNFEDIRRAKSILGQTLLTAGAITAGVGARQRSNEAVLAGAGMMILGAATRAGARADTRYCDVFPQRLYMVPLKLSDQDDIIELQIDGKPGSRLVLRGLDPPADPHAVQLRYVRLNQPIGARPAPGWAMNGRLYYMNEHMRLLAPQHRHAPPIDPLPPEDLHPDSRPDDSDRIALDQQHDTFSILARTPAAWTEAVGISSRPNLAVEDLPFVFGGRDVRPPSADQLQRLHEHGLLRDVSLETYLNAFRDEGLLFVPDDAPLFPAERHVLEGGRWHLAPLPGTAGFARLFGQNHPPYRPQSPAMRRMAESIARELSVHRSEIAAAPGPGPRIPDPASASATTNSAQTLPFEEK